jgi:hypothetical protein
MVLICVYCCDYIAQRCFYCLNQFKPHITDPDFKKIIWNAGYLCFLQTSKY